MEKVINLKWEYRHEFIVSNKDTAKILNKLGNDGWECFAVDFNDAGIQCLLKRVLVDNNS